MLERKVDEIQHLKFEIKNPYLKSLISKFNDTFVPMIKELKEYGKEKGFEYRFMGHQARLEDAFRDHRLCYYTSMSLPTDKQRIMSLRNVMRGIYELWVLKHICQCLQVSRFTYHTYMVDKKPYWQIEHGSEYSTFIGETPFGEISAWWEFQENKYIHMIGMMLGRHVAVKPDIVVVSGHYERTSDFVKSGRSMDLLVECKEESFETWEKDIRSQIIPYKKKFKPRYFIVASLEPVLAPIKSRLLFKYQIRVIDNLKPNSRSISTLCNIVRKIFEERNTTSL